MTSFSLAAAVLLASLSASPSAQAGGSLSREWAADWSAKRLDEVMRLYAPAPVFLPTVGPRWEGATAIRKHFAGLLAKFNPRIVLHSMRSETSGNLSYDSGTYEETITPVNAGKPIAAQGSYLFIFQRQQNGEWKILEQTWTSLEPVKL